VEASANGQNTIRISVSDTGTGIDLEVLPRLFTKFTNKADMDRAQIGSGLGLYISKGIIETHGGRIWADNNKDGKGCTFWVDIPLLGQEITS
jgi:signal transduction histidine kinase